METLSKTAMTRHGKIARLPLPIRQQLNLRLQNGELAQNRLSWLNQLPEVQKPIDESNISHTETPTKLS